MGYQVTSIFKKYTVGEKINIKHRKYIELIKNSCIIEMDNKNYI